MILGGNSHQMAGIDRHPWGYRSRLIAPVRGEQSGAGEPAPDLGASMTCSMTLRPGQFNIGRAWSRSRAEHLHPVRDLRPSLTLPVCGFVRSRWEQRSSPLA
jgi:hypothetical protein